MLKTISEAIINIEPDDVIDRARENDLDVQQIEDFRTLSYHYHRIDKVMEDYRSSYARYSALGGLTTGIGGFTTSLTFAGLDTISLAVQLYRLSERFAILNGFDGNDPLQKDKMLNIYFEALSVNAFIQAGLKHQFLSASAAADSGNPSDSMLLKLIIKVAKILGDHLSSEEAGRLVPVVGGLIGATVNYSFARKTSKAMKKAYKRAYFETWQNE